MAAGLSRPILCMVTDRRRLPRPEADSLLRLVAAASAAGINLIQVRESDLDDRRLLDLTRRMLQAVGGSDTAVVVNERTDVALAAGAHGVHLRGDSASARRVRAIVPEGFLIGRSVHSAGEAAAESAGVDYLIMGTVYPTASKPGTVLAGIDGLEEVCRSVGVPVLAIGGVAADNVKGIAAAGAAGIAATGLFCDLVTATPDAALDPALTSLIATIRRAFTPRALPGRSPRPGLLR